MQSAAMPSAQPIASPECPRLMLLSLCLIPSCGSAAGGQIGPIL
jgi:hypothetical protein